MENDDYTMEEYEENTKFIKSIADVDYGYGKPIKCIHFDFPMPYDEYLTCGLQYNEDVYKKCLLLDGKDCKYKQGNF